jgi:hypothetical protein
MLVLHLPSMCILTKQSLHVIRNKRELTLQRTAETRRRNKIAKDWIEAQAEAEANAEVGDGQQGDGVVDAMAGAAGPESESGDSSDGEDDEADVHSDGAGCACDICRAKGLWLGVGYMY